VSHISVVKTEIRNPNVTIAMLAFENMIKKYNANRTNVVRDWFGNKTEVLIGMEIDNRTVGLRINNGVAELVADKYLWGKKFEEIMSEFTQNYITLAILQALKSERYDVSVKEIKGAILIDAYR